MPVNQPTAQPSKPSKPNKQSERRERTRRALLDAAEVEFADRGFAGARVESIAQAAGIRRASLFYHFPDKSALYRALIEDRLLPYFEQVEKLLSLRAQPVAGPGAPAGGSTAHLDLVVRGISMQADFISQNPRLARIFLREITDHDEQQPSLLAPFLHPIVERVKTFLEARALEGLCRPVESEHLVTAVIGSTLLHVVARPLLHPNASTDRLSGKALEAHKRELSEIVRRLLGLDAEQLGSARKRRRS